MLGQGAVLSSETIEMVRMVRMVIRGFLPRGSRSSPSQPLASPATFSRGPHKSHMHQFGLNMEGAMGSSDMCIKPHVGGCQALLFLRRASSVVKQAGVGTVCFVGPGNIPDLWRWCHFEPVKQQEEQSQSGEPEVTTPESSSF